VQRLSLEAGFLRLIVQRIDVARSAFLRRNAKMHRTETVVDDTLALEPLTIDDAKDQVRIYTDDLNRQLVDAVQEIRAYCETYTGRTLRTEVTRELSMSEWPCRAFRLPWPPITYLSWIKYCDVNNTEQSVSEDDYSIIKSTDMYGIVEFVADWVKPALYNRLDAVKIQYVTGYETRDAVPLEIKRAMKILLSVEFDDVPPAREANAVGRAKAMLIAADLGAYG